MALVQAGGFTAAGYVDGGTGGAAAAGARNGLGENERLI